MFFYIALLPDGKELKHDLQDPVGELAQTQDAHAGEKAEDAPCVQDTEVTKIQHLT